MEEYNSQMDAYMHGTQLQPRYSARSHQHGRERGGRDDGKTHDANGWENVLNFTQFKIRCCLCVSKDDRQKIKREKKQPNGRYT